MTNQTMSNFQSLVVRACKDGTKLKRIKRLYQANYVGTCDMYHICMILSDILRDQIEKGGVDFLMKLISDAAPRNVFAFGGSPEEDHCTRFARVLISRIRLSKLDDLPHYTLPAKWRNK